jgi:hypothetical protein
MHDTHQSLLTTSKIKACWEVGKQGQLKVLVKGGACVYLLEGQSGRGIHAEKEFLYPCVLFICNVVKSLTPLSAFIGFLFARM